MFNAQSVRREHILSAITEKPGITKRELMEMFGLGTKAMEMHLSRMAGDRQIHGVRISDAGHKAWYVGEPKAARRMTSVFDMGMAA